MMHVSNEQRPSLHKGPGKNREKNHHRVGEETQGCGLAPWYCSGTAKLRGIQILYRYGTCSTSHSLLSSIFSGVLEVKKVK